MRRFKSVLLRKYTVVVLILRSNSAWHRKTVCLLGRFLYSVERSPCSTLNEADEVDDVGIHIDIGTIPDCHISYYIENKHDIIM